MRCPTLSELPSPPSGKKGWPWSEESQQLPDTMPGGHLWPRISIVTPSYNQGQFLEECIRSVLLQGYPNLEYIIIDGGSPDQSLSIIQHYSKWLTYWASEPDRGQTHAINKGVMRTTGTLLNYTNSDDFLLSNACRILAEYHLKHPGSVLLGNVVEFDHSGGSSRVIQQANVSLANVVDPWSNRLDFHQAGMFVPKCVHRTIGQLDEELRFAMDQDWLCRLLQYADVAYIGVPIASYRIHGAQKTTAELPDAVRERLLVSMRYWNKIAHLNKPRLLALHGLFAAAVHLGYHPTYSEFWNRAAGARFLFSALRRYPQIISVPQFRKLCLRTLLPRRLYRSNPWRTSKEK